LLAPLVLAAAACSRIDQPTRVLERFYGAAIAGDEETARRFLVVPAGDGQAASVDLQDCTRAGSLERIEVLDVNVWSEQRANGRVRKHFRDGTSEELRVEFEGHGGRWRIMTPASEL